MWAPAAGLVELVVEGGPTLALEREHAGYHVGTFDLGPGTRYRYRLDRTDPVADPASRLQPDGVHGPSEVVAAAPPGGRATWRGVPLHAQVICEVHVGTYSPEGTFAGVEASLGELAGAGYTVVELMPVAAFPGEANWGYDGVFPFAVQASYGGPEGLRRLCAAAHDLGIGVVLDLVANHLGPEGAVQERFGPYLTDRYTTPWGRAINLDGPGSDEVRRYFVEAACYAVRELGVDGLRLDAVHELADRSASPFLAELTAAVHAEGRRLGRQVTVVAESPDNDPRLVTAPEAGGIGLDGVWNDDFHHALRVALTGERDRYFADYEGLGDLAEALVSGFVVAGRPSPVRGRRHGAPARHPLAGDRLVVFAQNHDQVGNGGYGRRLADQLGLEAQFPVAAAVLLSGGVPLRFMGEEYGETAPFHFFADHGDEALRHAVTEGRRAEIGAHAGVQVPDPFDPDTVRACRPDRSLAASGLRAELLAWQRRLLELRRAEPALGCLEPERSVAWFDEAGASLVLVRHGDPYLGGRPVAVALRLSGEAGPLECPLLAGCGLEVLAARHAPGSGEGTTHPPGTDGPVVDLGGFGVLVAALAPPAPVRSGPGRGVRTSATRPRPPLS